MLVTHSRISTDEAGWTWLAPDRRSLALRHGLVSFAVSLLFVAAAAAATIPPPVLAVPLFAVVVAAGAAIVRAAWRDTHTRIGVSSVGVVVLQGARHDELSWSTVVAVTGERRAGRVRLRVATRSADVRPTATFSRGAAEAWLAVAEDVAAPRLRPRSASGGLGFVAGQDV